MGEFACLESEGFLDGFGVPVGGVEDVEGAAGQGAGEEVADRVAVGLDGGEEIVGEEMAVPDQEDVGLGEAA